MAVADFHKLERRLRLSGSLRTVTGLRVGAGGTSLYAASDLPVLRDGEEQPFIPGSSLKGALRSTLEGLVRGVDDPAKGLWSCDPLREAPRDADLSNAAVRRGYACGSHPSGERSGVEPEWSCSICRLFGSRIVASHVRFSDLHVRRRGATPPIELRDGVALDRDLGVASGAQKYDFEVVPPGVTFDLELFVENPVDWQLGLLVVGFDQLSEGLTALGGFTSRGLGRVEVEWESLLDVSARQLLEGERGATMEGAALTERLEEWRRSLRGKAQAGES